MPSTATNRSAALAGAWSAIGGFAWASIADHFPAPYEILQWWVNLFVLGAIFFVPFFRWVIGADFKFDGQGLSLKEQWLAMPEKYSRIGIWAISMCTVGVILRIIIGAFFE
jgi:hypothetical protein